MTSITVGDTSQIQKPMNEYLKERKQRDDANPYMREQREAEISADCVDMEGVQVLAGTIIEALQAAVSDSSQNPLHITYYCVYLYILILANSRFVWNCGFRKKTMIIMQHLMC